MVYSDWQWTTAASEPQSNDVKLWRCSVFKMKVRDVIKIIQDDGWYLARTRGSHRHFKHPEKPGIVTVAEMNVDVPIGTLNSIWRQAQLDEDEEEQ